MPTLEHQIRVGVNWVTQPLQDLLTDVSKIKREQSMRAKEKNERSYQ